MSTIPRIVDAILIVEDDPVQLKSLETLVTYAITESEASYQIWTAASVEEALAYFSAERLQSTGAAKLVVVDMQLPFGGILNDAAGYSVIVQCAHLSPETRWIAITGQPGLDNILADGKSLLNALFDLPVGTLQSIWFKKDDEDLLDDLRAFLEYDTSEVPELSRPRLKEIVDEDNVFVCESDMRLFTTILRAAKGERTVLLLGEKGTGKELVAKVIHKTRHPSLDRFAVVDGARATYESLFGETGLLGKSPTRGILSNLAGGTAYISNIDKLSRNMQADLCRKLQFQEYDIRVVGGIETDPSRFEPTSLDTDLVVSSIPIPLPPLRKRHGDLPVLVDTFLEVENHKLMHSRRIVERRVLVQKPEIIQVLKECTWPNNLDDLRALIVDLCEDPLGAPAITVKRVREAARRRLLLRESRVHEPKTLPKRSPEQQFPDFLRAAEERIRDIARSEQAEIIGGASGTWEAKAGADYIRHKYDLIRRIKRKGLRYRVLGSTSIIIAEAVRQASEASELVQKLADEGKKVSHLLIYAPANSVDEIEKEVAAVTVRDDVCVEVFPLVE